MTQIKKRNIMPNTRQRALSWLQENRPAELINATRTSRHFPEQQIWFFTFPSTFFNDDIQGYLNILCEMRNNIYEFHYLKVPFSFFRENHERFDIRPTGKVFDLRISGKEENWLMDERGNNISFAQFEV